MIQLRPDQQQLETAIYSSWLAGNRNVLAVGPTGFGKTVVIGEIAYKKNLQGSTQVKIAHRNELVGQISMAIARRGITHRIIGPKPTIQQITAAHRKEFNGHSFVNPDARCSVAGIDTLIARQEELSRWAQQVDHWTIDEAHHVLRDNKWGRGASMFPNAYGLGVTASPRRGDGKGLGRGLLIGDNKWSNDGLFDDMVLGPDMRWLIDNGALCDYEIACPQTDFHIDDAEFDINGELSPAKGRAASQKSHIVSDVVKEYITRSYGKRGITFTTDIETANDIAKRFNDCGIPCAAVSSKTPAGVRDEYINRFRSGKLWMLVNVDLFGEGFDVPAVEVVIMARPTASLAVYLQQFGRALRVLAGKLYGLVIDLVSNFKRHGFPDKKHIWSLDRLDRKATREKDPEEIELIACRGCSRPYERVKPACPHCGWSPPIAAGGGVRTLEQVDGDLMLLDRATLERMRAATVLESPADLSHRVAAVAGEIAGRGAANRLIEKHGAQQRLSAAIAQWAGIQRHMGRSDQESYRRFYLTAGVDVFGALSADRSRAEYDKLADMVEGWFR